MLKQHHTLVAFIMTITLSSSPVIAKLTSLSENATLPTVMSADDMQKAIARDAQKFDEQNQQNNNQKNASDQTTENQSMNPEQESAASSSDNNNPPPATTQNPPQQSIISPVAPTPNTTITTPQNNQTQPGKNNWNIRY